MDFTKLTRAQAERAVAATNDEEMLLGLVKHKNSHVQKKAKHKLETGDVVRWFRGSSGVSRPLDRDAWLRT